MEHFVAGARRYLDKKYPTQGPFGARNRDRFFSKVEQGLKVRKLRRVAMYLIQRSGSSARALDCTSKSRDGLQMHYCYRRQISPPTLTLVVSSA